METGSMSDAMAIKIFFGLSSKEAMEEIRKMQDQDKKELGDLAREQLAKN